MTAAIIKALHEVMTKVGYVQKKGKNAFHGYKYAGEADLLERLRPAMLDAGLVLIPSGRAIRGPDEHGNTTVEMEYTLAHTSGEVWPTPIVAFGSGNDKSSKGSVGDKGTYKAITGANKYLLFKLFQIETGDDPDADKDAEREAAPEPESASSIEAKRRIREAMPKWRNYDEAVADWKAMQANVSAALSVTDYHDITEREVKPRLSYLKAKAKEAA